MDDAEDRAARAASRRRAEAIALAFDETGNAPLDSWRRDAAAQAMTELEATYSDWLPALVALMETAAAARALARVLEDAGAGRFLTARAQQAEVAAREQLAREWRREQEARDEGGLKVNAVLETYGKLAAAKGEAAPTS